MRLPSPLRLALALALGTLVGCGASRKDIGESPDLTNDTGVADTGPVWDIGGETDPGDGLTLDALDITPTNATIFIDLTTTPATPATQAYTLTLHNPDGSTTDVSSSATITIDDTSLGSFTGNTFTSTTSLPTGVLGVTSMVRAEASGKSAVANLTVVALRKTGDKRDFYFVVPYGGAPSPDRDVLKFGTKIKQVDVAVVMDTTGSMSGSITNLKTNISTTMFPELVKAIPSVGMAVAHHDDYPYGSYGSSGSGDLACAVLQVITTDLKKAQDGANKLPNHYGGDGPESQIPCMYHVLTGKELAWPGGAVPKHTPATGMFGGVDFRPGSLPVVVEITDIDWHGTGHTPYSFTAPDMPDLKKAFADNNAKFIDVTNGAWSADETQADELSDATKSYIPPSAFGGSCKTGISGAARPATGPGGTCRLNFLHSDGTGVSTSIVTAIQAISVGSTFDVTAKASNDPTNADGVDATEFISALRAMDEGDAANGCPSHTAVDSDGDGVKDLFKTVVVGTPVCFEVLPKSNTTVKPKTTAQFFNAFIDVLGMPGSVKLDRRNVLFLVPPQEIAAK